MSEDNQQLKEGDKVFVYFHLRKKLFSVRSQKTRLVVAHLTHVNLVNAEFIVSQKGRERVLKEKVKNVHAGVIGIYTEKYEPENTEKATYNPYKYDSFVNVKNGEKVFKADFVNLNVHNKIPTINFK